MADNTEYKDILRIERDGLDKAGLKERQLGFHRPATANKLSDIKLVYKPLNSEEGETITFTPDGGDSTFNSLKVSGTISESSADTTVITKGYLNKQVTKLKSVDPTLSGFVNPDEIYVKLNKATEEIEVYPSDGTRITDEAQSIPIKEQEYYVNNEKFSFGSKLSEKIPSDIGRRFVFLEENQKINISASWITGALPIASYYRSDAASNPFDKQFLTITRDYHGTSMGSAAKHYVNTHTGCWIEWGCETHTVGKNSLKRYEGAIVNDDVSHHLPEVTEVKPYICYMTKAQWGEEEYQIIGPTENWVSELTTVVSPDNYQTKYQRLSEVPGGSIVTTNFEFGDTGNGTWCLHFVHSDLRTTLSAGTPVDKYDDIIMPLSISKSWDERYDGLDDAIREVVDHYNDFVVDWKVLGLVFIADNQIKEHVHIASLTLKDLLHGPHLEKLLRDKVLDGYTKTEVDTLLGLDSNSPNTMVSLDSTGTQLQAIDIEAVEEGDTLKLGSNSHVEYRLWNTTISNAKSFSVIRDSVGSTTTLFKVEGTSGKIYGTPNHTPQDLDELVNKRYVDDRLGSTGDDSISVIISNDPVPNGGINVSGTNVNALVTGGIATGGSNEFDGLYTSKGTYYQKGTESKFIVRIAGNSVWCITDTLNLTDWNFCEYHLTSGTPITPQKVFWQVSPTKKQLIDGEYVNTGTPVTVSAAGDNSGSLQAFTTNGDINTTGYVRGNQLVVDNTLSVRYDSIAQAGVLESYAAGDVAYQLRHTGQNRMQVNSDGTVEAPTAAPTSIESAGEKVLVTKEYTNQLVDQKIAAAGGGSGSGTSKMIYGFSRTQWTSGGLFGPNGSNGDTHGTCSHIVLASGTITKLGYFFEGHNEAGPIKIYVNDVEITTGYTAPSIPCDTNVNGLLTGMSIPVAEGDRLRINVVGGGRCGQISVIVEG